MIKKMLSRKWLWALIIVCIPITYSLFRITNIQYWDNAIGNLLATIFGVVFGIPIGLEINRVQQEAQRKREEELKREENTTKEKLRNEEQEEILKINVENVYRELVENRKHLVRLQHALDQIDISTDVAWEWLRAISDSLSSEAYFHLSQSMIDENRWRDLHLPLYIAYPETLLGLRNRIREGRAARSFYLTKKLDRKVDDDELQFIRDLARETLRRVDEAKQEVDRFRRYKKYIKN